ncbi:SH3 domain-containing protein [Methylocystis sp. JAN1]|uniref:SH3 domain-containing protein n=1 Tax=Methylocystis sp. JAN1 TaxID=3397211 RepID=UPI003FA29A3D
MRRSIYALTTALALVASGASLAEVVTLRAPVDLRAKPGAKRPVVITVAAGGELDVVKDGREWVVVSFQGRSFYASAAQLTNATPSDRPSPDPTCDYGYPYSGSNLFFTRPLAQLRHSEPLGFLLGYHNYYPC